MCGDTAQPGLLPRVATAIGQRVSELSSQASQELKCSYIEVYNEQIFDLLGAPVANKSKTSKLKVEIDREGEPHVRGLEEVTAKSTDELFALIARGQAQRATVLFLFSLL